MSKKQTEEKEPNYKLSLCASIFFIIVCTLCIPEILKDYSYMSSGVGVIVVVFFTLFDVCMIWLSIFIIKKIKEGHK